MSVFALYGGMAALFLIHSVLQSPRAWLTWLGFLVGVPLGGLLGVFCTLLVLQMMLRAASPSRLEGDPSGLRVKVWNTWNGLNFRRTDVRVPLDQLAGVGLKTGQGGQSQLFLLHSSGQPFGTGWSGSKAEAMQLGGRLADWIATARERVSGGSVRLG